MYTIITNNELIANKFRNIKFIKGSFLKILLETRDYLHQGYSLSIHPLPSSIRMLFSPIRSIIIKKDNNNIESISIMERAIEKYNITLKNREVDYKNIEDYKLIDENLTLNAIKQIADFNQKEEK